ncbi:MAG: hypothetical protein JWM74_96 [Myxococcaceae bacterium]|nr:hypothetical protein [Myxococcaceae bacterium]
MRSLQLVLIAALATTFACQRRQAPEAVQTEITSAEMPRPERGNGQPTELQEFRDNARRDLMNLDRRIRYLEIRAASNNAPRQARIEIAEARDKRDALARAIDGLEPSTWQSQRDTLDRDWEEASNLTDSVSSMLTDEAR